MEKISVIIPMYNTEPYIRRCLQSLQDQTYRNWEAIVVNDGSTDRSPDICREIAAADPRVRVISQDNGGVSSARNRGLDAAQGAFLFFLDSDDAIHPLLLEEMILQAHRTGADFLACGQAKLRPEQVDPALSTASIHDERPVWETPSREESPSLMFSLVTLMPGIGGKMIRRSAVEGSRFREDLFLGEDTFFIYQLLCQLPQTAYTFQEWYFYIRFPESLTNSRALYTSPRYYEVYHVLQEYDLAMGWTCEAVQWEEMLLNRLRDNYLLSLGVEDAEGMAAMRKIAAAEYGRTLFHRVSCRTRWPFRLCFFSYPCYQALLFIHKRMRRQKSLSSKKAAGSGGGRILSTKRDRKK